MIDAAAALSIGGIALMLALRAAPPKRGDQAPAVRHPGWLARRRALRGLAHKPQQVGVGYVSAFKVAYLDVQTLNHHGYVTGAPGSGKTTLLRQTIEGYPGPVIALDAKGSTDLADTVWGIPGHVWQIGSPLKLDVLDPEPAILAQQLLEGETFTDRAQVYRAIAEHAVQRAAWVLRWKGEPRTPQGILELIASPAVLSHAIRQAMPRDDAMAQRWLTELDSPTATIREAYQTFGERLGTLLDSPAGQSLGTGPLSLSLSDVVATNSKLLIRLDPRYGALSRKIGAWVLVAMIRLAAELRQASCRKRLLFVVDEPRVLGHEGRHLADLFGTARDAGIGLVVADQGIAGLTAIHPDMPDAILRSTAWQLVLRQGSYEDARRMADLLRNAQVEAAGLLGLQTAAGWLRVAPTTLRSRERIERIAVAQPRGTRPIPLRALPAPSSVATVATAERDRKTPTEDGGRPGPQTVRELVEACLLAPDDRGCVTAGPPVTVDGDGYARVWWSSMKRYITSLHKRRWEWEVGPVPAGWEVDHLCRNRRCLAIEHLKSRPKNEHRAVEAERRRSIRASGQGSAARPLGPVANAPSRPVPPHEG